MAKIRDGFADRVPSRRVVSSVSLMVLMRARERGRSVAAAAAHKKRNGAFDGELKIMPVLRIGCVPVIAIGTPWPFSD